MVRVPAEFLESLFLVNELPALDDEGVETFATMLDLANYPAALASLYPPYKRNRR